MLAFEHVDLLTQGHDFQAKAISRAQEGREPFKETLYQFEHEGSLQGRRDPRRSHKPPVSQRNRVLATHKRQVTPSRSLKNLVWR